MDPYWGSFESLGRKLRSMQICKLGLQVPTKPWVLNLWAAASEKRLKTGWFLFKTHRCPLEIPQIVNDSVTFLQQHLATPLFLCQPRNALTPTQCKGWYTVVLTLLDRSSPTQIYDIFASIQGINPFLLRWHGTSTFIKQTTLHARHSRL